MKEKRKRFFVLALCCLVLALGIFGFSHFLYHYVNADFSLSAVYLTEPQKPMVTWLFAIWGVCFLFAGVFSLLLGIIFGSEPKDKR